MDIKPGIKVRYLGSDNSALTRGHIYTVLSAEDGNCRLIETGSAVDYPLSMFAIFPVEPGTKVRWLGPTEWLMCTKGKVYTVLSVEKEWFRIVDDSGEDYLYPPERFEIVE